MPYIRIGKPNYVLNFHIFVRQKKQRKLTKPTIAMEIKIDENLRIELINESHSQAIFNMVDQNRTHLREWLPFVDRMESVLFAENFVKGSMQRNKDGVEYAFVIIDHETVVGRIGVYKIDNQNKIGEIGYWLVENLQGKGIVTKTCKALIDFCFSELELNRMEIKCGTENHKSKTIPEKLNFTHEGVIRQGELLFDKFIDLNLYSFTKSDRKKLSN
ncbi:GNAT family N-acetyltransferase [Flavobacterium sp. GT3R68]|uniref:GNAT family N-acetyltransferase n=1 Tax=Flavobacterium sp. GT3R68 TaxID=2594437 RepID=UPI000F8865EF|nr:GNAT family protein [Flavobacterium sp. GT3R68]RTY89129.1 N-acetyltransferase [Flavobacterium sp. GSN2]TRW90073.1 GNAT family N-acetyltransferase [Flavobacterium sp. GT3R68]